MPNRKFPAALLHGELRELFPDIFFVTGTMRMQGKPMSFSRNMVIVREGRSLTLINTVRLDEYGLRALAKLGSIDNVIRLAGFHGMDDPFYQDRYGARVFAIKGQSYGSGFDVESKASFMPDEFVDGGSELPITGSRLYVLKSAKPAEGVLVLLRNGGILVTGDSLQNWRAPDRYFSLLSRLMMPFMGFIKAYNIGPVWRKLAKPSSADLNGLLELRFDHVLPAHGDEVIGNARELFRSAIERAAGRSAN